MESKPSRRAAAAARRHGQSPGRARPGRRTSLTAAAVLLGLASAAHAHRPEPGVAVAVFPERFPPVFTVTANGLPDGFGIELMEAIAAEADLKIHYHAVPSWPDAFEAVARGEADLVPNLGITERRKAGLRFSHPVDQMPVSVFVRAGEAAIDGPQDLSRARHGVAVVEDNVAAELLERRADLHLHHYPSVSEAFFALLEGNVSALVYPQTVIEHMARTAGSAERIETVGEPVLVIERAVAVRREHAELHARIDAALERLQGSATIERIYERWHGDRDGFWTVRRLSYIFGDGLALMLAAGLYWRFRLLHRVNREVTAANAFNAAVLDAAREGIVTVNAHGRIRAVNRGAQRIFLRAEHELIERPLRTIVKHEDDDIESVVLAAGHAAHADDAPEPALEVTGVRGNGERFPVHVGVAHAQVHGDTLYVCTVYDLSDQREAERQAAFLADHDPLTGLLNPRGTLLVLQNTLDQARRHGREVACLHVGLARFGQVNNLYGRDVGDRALVRLGRLLEANLRISDLAGREEHGFLTRPDGAGFLLVLPQTDAEGAVTLARRLRTTLAGTVLLVDGHRIHVHIKIGIACFPDHAETATELLSYAHGALAEAKRDRAADVRVFTLETKTRETTDQMWLEEIHHALDEGRFELHFQPILHIGSGEIHHYEALVRMRNRGGTLVMPGDFIEVAERYGMIAHIDLHVLDRLFDHLEAIAGEAEHLSLAVNLSGAYLGDDELYDWLLERLQERNVDPRRLVFEVTETAAIRNVVRANSFIETLKTLGCRFALDDFGTGFSSFSYLRTLPVDTVKIDGSFVRDIVDNPADQALVQSVTRIAQSLGKTVVAEHVESAAVLERLRAYGVDYAQGFHIGYPAADPPALRSARHGASGA